MASITIRNLPDDTKKLLRRQAAENGRSVEAEARDLLNKGVAHQPATAANLFDALRKRFEPLGGVEPEIPRRGMAEEKQPFRTPDNPAPKAGIAESIRRRFAPFGGVELEPFPDEVLEAPRPPRKPRKK